MDASHQTDTPSKLGAGLGIALAIATYAIILYPLV